MGKTVGNLDKHIQIDLSNFSVNGHTHDYTTWVGDHVEAATGSTANSPYTGMAKSTTKGLYLTGSYNDANTPAMYGNILNLAGRGTGQLLCEWKSGTTSSTGDLYYRSHRDNAEAPWGPWKKIAYTDSNITGNAATATQLATARTITIGNQSNTFNGTANISYTLDGMGLGPISSGLNKILFERYGRGSITGNNAVLLSDLIGKPLIDTRLIDNFGSYGVGDTYLGCLSTNIYFSADTDWTTTATSDDGSSIYLNGVLIASLSSCTATEVTLSFKAGWNKLIWVFNENAGSDSTTFSSSFKSLANYVYCYAYPISECNNYINAANYKIQLNGGTTEGTNQFTYNGNAAKTINITPASIGAAASSHGTHVTYSSTAPKVAGTAAVGSEGAVARGDHVHAAQTSVSGNAGTATKLATARNIIIGNKTNSFDGSANITYTLADIGAAASNHTHGLLHDSLAVTLSNTTTDNGWSMINSSYYGFLLKSIRTNASAPNWICNDYSAGIAFGGADTKGVLSMAYNAPNIKFAGGNGSKPVWWIGLTGTSGTSYNLANFENKNHGTHVTYSTTAPKVAGTASVGSAANVARGDHVHPAQTSVSGNAGTATKLATARTLTIGNTGKSFDGSANVSWSLNEIGASNKFLVRDEYTQITVNGDANKYYPVLLNASNVSSYPTIRVNISRTYSWTAPNTWNNSTHRGGLTFTLVWNCSKYWDGNGTGSAPVCYVEQFTESYATMVAGLSSATTGIVVWLRGGGALYQINSSIGKAVTAEVKLEGFTDGASQTFSVRDYNATTVDNEIKKRWVNRSTNGVFDNNNRVYSAINKPTPADIGAAASSHTHAYLPTAGGTMSGKITTPNNAPGITIGDDVTICDRNVANFMVLEGTTATAGGIIFGSGKDTNIYRGGANILKTDDTMNAVGGFQWNGQSLDSRYAAASHGTHLTIGTGSGNAAAGNHTHNQINSRGNVTAETGTNRPAVGGLSMGCVYDNGYPTTYGNVMTMKGTGDGQLLIGWSGTSGAHAPAYIRSKRDTTDANWSGWAQIYTTAHKPTPADLGLQREYKSAVADIYSSGITTGGSTLAADTYASHGKSYSFASTTKATVIYKAAFPELKYGKYAICVRMMSSNNTSTSNIAKIEILQGTTVKKTVNITGKNFTSTSNYSYIYTDFEYTGNASAKQALSIQVSSLTVSGITLKFDYASIEMMSPAVFL